MRRGIATLVALLLLAPAAQASSRMESTFQDDDLLLHSTPAEVDAAMAELKGLGVDRIRLPAIWRDIAPETKPADGADPAAYPAERIDKLDVAVLAAANNGLTLLLNPRGDAPDWALGAKPPRKIADRKAYKPSQAQFGAFVKMLGRRYDGTYTSSAGDTLPRVDAWSIWNEPNWGGLLQPQSQKLRGKTYPFAPRWYRGLYRRATSALSQTEHAGDVILLGETAPLGEDRLSVASPLLAGRFYRELFCLDRRLRPLRGADAKRSNCRDFKRGPLAATGVAHHPYPVLAAPEFKSIGPDEIRLADVKRLVRILDAARRYKRVKGKLPIWYTEFGYQTNPPDPYRGVSPAKQARWLVRAEHMAFRNRRVLAFNQFLLRDSPAQEEYPVSDPRYWSSYQTGLEFADGTEKPAYAAYRLPFMRVGKPGSGRFWGMVRPGADAEEQAIRIEYRANADAAWTSVADRRVRSLKGTFSVKLAKPARGQYRLVWAGPDGEVASPVTSG